MNAAEELRLDAECLLKVRNATVGETFEKYAAQLLETRRMIGLLAQACGNGSRHAIAAQFVDKTFI